MSGQLLKVGLVGTVITAVCCFTPALVILFGIIGLSWAVGYLDLVLLPALVIFASLTGFALWQRLRKTSS